MKSGYSILTRRIKGIDIHIWLTFFTIVIISGGILIMRIIKNVECKNFNINAADFTGSKSNSFYVNENVTFSINTSGSTTWDFGDGFHADGAVIKHKFINDGKQTIIATQNGKCPQMLTLDIHKNVVADQTDIDAIYGPQNVIMGQVVSYIYIGKRKATAYEWTIVNSRIQPLQHSKKASYTFDKSGTQIVELQLDHDASKTYQKTIVISPAQESKQKYKYQAPSSKPLPPIQGGGSAGSPVPANKINIRVDTPVQHKQIQLPVDPPNKVSLVEPKKSSIYYSDEDFQRLFEDVIVGKKTAQNFNPYLCNGGSTIVIANGKEETVESICGVLYRGKYKIVSFSIARDAKNCVVRMRINYKNKFLIF
jgi:hypothetical protein